MPARVTATVWVATPDRVLGCLSFGALSAAVRVWRVGLYEFGSKEVMSVMSFCLENDDPIFSRFCVSTSSIGSAILVQLGEFLGQMTQKASCF